MQAERSVFLKAKWEYLAMINFEVDSKILLPHLPAATELDLYKNKALVSVVGFMFNNTKVFGMRWPFHANFEEVNLRFYVRHFDGTAWKRGVVFVSEIVPKHIIAYMANRLYHEHYSAKPMRHSMSVDHDEILLSYKWKHRKNWNSIEVTANAISSAIKPGSEEEFIFEHYWGYNKYNANTTVQYGVEHARWQVHTVKKHALCCDVASLYGEEFVPFLAAKPRSVFLAQGSEVIIRKPEFMYDG